MNAETYLAKLKTLPVRIYLATSGAAAGIQQTLWDPNAGGASKILVGATFPYSKEASVDFLGYTPESFVSLAEAIDLAISSYLKADNGDPTQQPIGLGLTAAVTSTVQHRGNHRVHAVVITRDRCLASEVILPKESTSRKRDGLIADNIGMELILAAARLLPEKDEREYREATDGQCLKDITQLARDHFMSRPMFTRFGKREVAPTGVAKLYPGNFDPPHLGHFEIGPVGTVFQITANPPHKPVLTLPEMLGRVRHFLGKREVLFTEGYPLYLDKARRFPGATIVLGSDALRRMLDPQWGVEVVPMLNEFRKLGTRFEVGLRNDDTIASIPIPREFLDLFTVLPRSVLYSKLSSTQIRQAQGR